MRVLITNNRLAERAGTELYVRDVATALLARGHSPIVFSPVLGEVAAELRARTVPVLDDLRSLAEPPDVIHGHHHLPTMIAALRFPATPVISFCHGWLPWEEAPPRFPTILRYVAVDRPCLERLVLENGIDRRRVRLIRNFVDVERFRAREPLPPRPARALLFSNYASEENIVGAVREACRRRGIVLEIAGLASGNPTARPEAILGRFDVVFAKGRAALEAAAVGTAVILCDRAGLGPMVRARDLERLRDLNFGIRTLERPVTADNVERELERYDAADAAEVSRRIRAEAALGPALDAIVSLYEEVVAEHARSSGSSPAEALAAASSYLRWLAPRLREADRWRDAAASLERQLKQAAAAQDAERYRLAVERDRLAEEVRREASRGDALAAELRAIERAATWRLRNVLRRSTLLRNLLEPALRRIRGAER